MTRKDGTTPMNMAEAFGSTTERALMVIEDIDKIARRRTDLDKRVKDVMHYINTRETAEDRAIAAYEFGTIVGRAEMLMRAMDNVEELR